MRNRERRVRLCATVVGAVFVVFQAALGQLAFAQESPPSPVVEVVTPASIPAAPILGQATTTSFSIDIQTADNPTGTEYAAFETRSGLWIDPVGKTIASTAVVWAADSGAWRTASGGIVITGLSPSAFYTIRVKARNAALEETELGPASIIGTLGTDAVNANVTPPALEPTPAPAPAPVPKPKPKPAPAPNPVSPPVVEPVYPANGGVVPVAEVVPEQPPVEPVSPETLIVPSGPVSFPLHPAPSSVLVGWATGLGIVSLILFGIAGLLGVFAVLHGIRWIIRRLLQRNIPPSV